MTKKSLVEIYDEIYNNYPSLSYVGFYKAITPGIVLRDPKLVKEVMITNFSSFQDNEVLVQEEVDSLLTRNPFFSSGEKWKTNRTQLTPYFTTKQTKLLLPLTEAVCKKLNIYLQDTDHGKNGVEAKGLFKKFTVDVMASCTMGFEINSFVDPNNEFRNMIQKIFVPSFFTTIKLFFLYVMPSLTRFLKVRIIPEDVADHFRRIVAEVMAHQKTNNTTSHNFLGMMQEHSGKLEKNVLSNEDITANLMGFLVDSLESGSSVLSHVLYEMGANPNLQDKARLEIDETLEKHGGQFSYEALQEMTYLNKFINESLRVHPPVMFIGKYCTKQITLPSPHGNGAAVTIEPGTFAVVPVYSLHYDPKYYPDPNTFDPERFSEENRSTHVKGTFLPFGDGPRVCIGQKFATVQIKMALAYLISTFEVRVNNKTMRPLQIDSAGSFLFAKGGIWLDFHKRSND